MTEERSDTFLLTRPWFFWSVLGGVLMLGVFVRLQFWPNWLFVDDPTSWIPRPLLLNSDGYFYLALARDFLDSVYHHAESLRVFPERPPRPDPIPLLSLITAWVTQLSSLPLELVAAVLPAFLGSLIALPVALIARPFVGSSMALAAATFAVLMPYFVQRSMLGWYDTDPLTVILPFSMAALAMAWLHHRPNLRQLALSLVIYVACVGLLWLWWDQAPQVVALLSIYPLLLTIMLCWSDQRFRYAGLGLLTLVIIMLPITVNQMITRTLGVFRYVSNQGDSVFSPAAIATSEQQPLGFTLSSEMATGGWLMLIFALAGLAYLARQRPVILLPLLPLAFISTLGLFQAQRFLIFLAPITALGLAGILAFVRDYLSRSLAIPAVVILFFTFAATLNLSIDSHVKASPIVPKMVVEHLRELSQKLPEDAVLWNFCVYGYAQTYWARRATTCDGSSHSGARRTFMAAPFYADSPQQAARFMYFFLAHGASGMQRLLRLHDRHWPSTQAFIQTVHTLPPDAARVWLTDRWPDLSVEAVDEWIEFLFPAPKRPVYLLLDQHNMRNPLWWFWFSSWDPEQGTGIHPDYIVLPNFPTVTADARLISVAPPLVLDLDKGIVELEERTINLRRLNWINRTNQQKIDFNHEEHWIMDIVTTDRYGVLHDSRTHHKVGHQLYLQTMINPLFEPVLLAGSQFQIWRVHHPEGNK